MKYYAITAKNKLSGSIEHAATSDLPFKINPFTDMVATHEFEYLEFDNKEGDLVRARELLKNLQTGTGTLKADASKTRFSSMKRGQNEL
jgi:hypothetical protein